MIQRYELFYGLLILSTFFSWKLVKEKYGWVAFLLLAWVLIDALVVCSWPGLTFDTLSLRLRLVSARSFLLVTMLVFFMQSFEFWHMKRVVQFFEALVVINCGLYIYFGHGVMNAGSADMSFMSMLYPMMLFRKKINWKRALILIPFPVCLFVQVPGSTVFFALAIGLGSYMLLKKKWTWFLACLAFVPGIIYLGYKIGLSWEGGFFYNSGRFEPWKLIMSWWVEWANMWIGTGTGTFQWLGPTIQDKDRDLLTFLHNEYLQILFEQGVLGCVLVGLLILICLKKAWKTPWLFACVMSTLFVFSVQFPLRYFFSQLAVLLLIRLCLDEDAITHLERGQ